MNRHRFADSAALHAAAAQRIAALAAASIAARGAFHIALSGGNTPRGLHAQLATLADIDWPAWHIWFGDERCVPPDHPDSNYHMARETLLDRVPIPAAHIHPMIPNAQITPPEAARAYARQLREQAPQHHARPALDLILLGLGPDGHTASLFPGTSILDDREHDVAEVYVARLSAWRVSLTYPVIENARDVLFLVDGSGKADILHRLEHGPAEGATPLPVERLKPRAGYEWYIAEPAPPPPAP
ncbi:6-phosphogluconolactonase [Acidihalobacter ferrooxydans]|uniref:6-phosphogluconolactonase n=1 Tax=Acidihalobacter ferrooxydans TaxID=1765967 RepID=A0A1P8UJZ6_9GAMM|nr:6-phosphogluconolactonase [Acidihalobacter ferrooxydans]APZ44124.1 6-phosphogluconolactonase [Acidihalobacter ferrooxydans]